MFGGTPTAAILGKDKKLRDRLNKEAENRANRKRLNKHAMETLMNKKNKIDNRIDVTVTKKDDLGLSPAEIRENKKRKNLGRTPNKMAPKIKVKSEKEKDLKRLEEIKKNQAAEDAARKKKAEESKKKRTGTRGKPIGSGIYGKGPLGKNFIGKKLNMGGAMKNRGGTFKGVY